MKRMKEHAETEVKIGMLRSPNRVVAEIEKAAQKMAAANWHLVRTVPDVMLGSVFLFFEREISDADMEEEAQ